MVEMDKDTKIAILEAENRILKQKFKELNQFSIENLLMRDASLKTLSITEAFLEDAAMALSKNKNNQAEIELAEAVEKNRTIVNCVIEDYKEILNILISIKQ